MYFQTDPSDIVNACEKPKEAEKLTDAKVPQTEKADIEVAKAVEAPAEKKVELIENKVVEVETVELIKDDGEYFCFLADNGMTLIKLVLPIMSLKKIPNFTYSYKLNLLDSKSTEVQIAPKETQQDKPDTAEKEVDTEKAQENAKEPTDSTEQTDLVVDNSDNACDASDPKDTVTVEIEDAASNCSTNSNLLKSGPKSAMDQEREEYGKAKRLRMSIDTEDVASNMSTDTDISVTYSSHSLKRSHSNSPTLGDDDSTSKKSKLSEKIPEKLELNKDIAKKIHRKLKKMKQKDLEHLVLQKIVESINYESKLSVVNEQLEKSQDKIEKFSQQYTNLKKQFNDLQLVHTRVTADLEKRNTSYVMPIKITRAVGLQVSIGTKTSVDGKNTYVVNSTNSTTTVKTPIVPSSPVHPPPALQTPTPTQNTSITQTQTPSPGSVARRGCVQKITPKRPVPVKVTTPNSQVTPVAPPQQQQLQPPKLLNRSAPTTPNLPKALIKPPVSTPPTQPSLTIANLERNIQKLTANNPIVRHNAPTSVM